MKREFTGGGSRDGQPERNTEALSGMQRYVCESQSPLVVEPEK